MVRDRVALVAVAEGGELKASIGRFTAHVHMDATHPMINILIMSAPQWDQVLALRTPLRVEATVARKPGPGLLVKQPPAWSQDRQSVLYLQKESLWVYVHARSRRASNVSFR